MPREIIHLSVGQCGNQIGHVFWNRILLEHNIKQDGFFNMHENLQYEDFFKLDKIEVYFQESSQFTDKYVPRTVMIDLEPGVIDKVLNSNIGNLFHPDFILTRASGAGNNWAKGHYTMGNEVIDETMDIIRKNVEGCDQLQGFQLSHSIGGGTGSGFGTLVLEKLKDEYPDRINVTWSIYPTQKVSDVVVEPYNAILAISHILTDSDASFVIDNEALFNISQKILKQKSPSFADLNWILSLVMGGCTASLRFPGLLNCDLRKMSVNLVPFPRLHFFTSAYSPLIQQGHEWKLTQWSLSKISDNVWNPKNLLTSIRKKGDDGKFLSASVHYRGRDISSAEIENITRSYLDKQNEAFVEWIPHNVKTSIITLKPESVNNTATMVGNVTSVKDCFERIWESFNKLFEKKAFIHWYKGEGMHELEFSDCEAEIKDLIIEYFEKQEIKVDLDDLFPEEDQYEEESASSVEINLQQILQEDKDNEKNNDDHDNQERKIDDKIVAQTNDHTKITDDNNNNDDLSHSNNNYDISHENELLGDDFDDYDGDENNNYNDQQYDDDNANGNWN